MFKVPVRNWIKNDFDFCQCSPGLLGIHFIYVTFWGFKGNTVMILNAAFSNISKMVTARFTHNIPGKLWSYDMVGSHSNMHYMWTLIGKF